MSFQSFNCLDAGHRADPFSFVLGRREESDRLPQVATRAFLRFEMDDLHVLSMNNER